AEGASQYEQFKASTPTAHPQHRHCHSLASYDKYRITPLTVESIFSLYDFMERSGSIGHVDVEYPPVGINQQDVPEPGQHCCNKPRFEVGSAAKPRLLNHVN